MSQPQLNRGASAWLRSYKFEGLGLPVPTDLPEYFSEDVYFKEYMAPICFIASGMSKEDFDFDLANTGTYEAQDYLMNKTKRLLIPNQLIQFFNNLGVGYAWMYVIRELCDYITPTDDKDQVVPLLKKSWRNYMQDHTLRYAVFDGAGVDVPVIINNGTETLAGSFPKEYVLYPEHLRAGRDTQILQNATKKPYYQLSGIELLLLQDAEKAGIAGESDYGVTRIPYITSEGAVEHREVTWKDDDVPPKEVMSYIGNMPKSVIDACGDEFHALIAMVDEGANVSDEIRMFVSTIRNKIVDDYDVPKPSVGAYVRTADAAVEARLKAEGFEFVEIAQYLRDYMESFEIPDTITLKQFFEWYETPGDDTAPPTPIGQITSESDVDRIAVDMKADGFSEEDCTWIKTTTFGVATTVEDAYKALAKHLSAKLEEVSSTQLTSEAVDKVNTNDLVVKSAELGFPRAMWKDDSRIINEDTIEPDYFWRQIACNTLDQLRPTKENIKNNLSGIVILNEVIDKAVGEGHNCHEVYRSIIKQIVDESKEKNSDLASFYSFTESVRSAIGMPDISDADLYEAILESINKSPETSGEAADAALYVDIFDKVGATMLQRVRELIHKDSSIDTRAGMKPVLYAYFRIMMCNHEDPKEVEGAKEALEERKQGATKHAIEILDEAIEILRG